MKLLTGSATDAALARYLGLTQPALVRWRNNETVPMSYCIEIAERTGTSLDYVYMGRATTARDHELGPLLDHQILERVLRRAFTSGLISVRKGDSPAVAASEIASDYTKAHEFAQRIKRSGDVSQDAIARSAVGSLDLEEAEAVSADAGAPGLLAWLASQGGSASNTSYEKAVVDQVVRAGFVERVTTGTDGDELLVLTPAGQKMVGKS
jgi:hypothetical protein